MMNKHLEAPSTSFGTQLAAPPPLLGVKIGQNCLLFFVKCDKTSVKSDLPLLCWTPSIALGTIVLSYCRKDEGRLF